MNTVHEIAQKHGLNKEETELFKQYVEGILANKPGTSVFTIIDADKMSPELAGAVKQFLGQEIQLSQHK
jgi:hypothetical protein